MEQLLVIDSHQCLISAVNVCEVYYDLLRRNYDEGAGALEDILDRYNLEIVGALPSAVWSKAGALKAQWRRVSLADCFGLALAIQEEDTFVTSDHKELDALAEGGVCPIRFIR